MTNNNNNNNRARGKRRRRRKRGGAAFIAGPSQVNLNTQNQIEELQTSNTGSGNNINNSMSVESVSTVSNSPVQEKKKGMFAGLTGAFSGMGNKVKGALGMSGGRRQHGGQSCASTQVNQNNRDNYCRAMKGENYSCVGGDSNSKGECLPQKTTLKMNTYATYGGRRKKRKTHKKRRKSHKKHRKSHKKRRKSHKKRRKSHKKRRTRRRRR